LQPPHRRVEHYTDAFLATLWLILFMMFWTIAAVAGVIWVLVSAYGIDLAIRWIGRARRG
jgi:hypothetical protein